MPGFDKSIASVRAASPAYWAGADADVTAASPYFLLTDARIFTEPPAFSTAATADFGAPWTLIFELGLELSAAEQPHAILGAAHHTRLDQRRQRITAPLASRQLGVDCLPAPHRG